MDMDIPFYIMKTRIRIRLKIDFFVFFSSNISLEWKKETPNIPHFSALYGSNIQLGENYIFLVGFELSGFFSWFWSISDEIILYPGNPDLNNEILGSQTFITSNWNQENWGVLFLILTENESMKRNYFYPSGCIHARNGFKGWIGFIVIKNLII